VHLGIEFDAFVPFKGQELKWPKPAKDTYYWLLERAGLVFYTSEGGYEEWKMQQRNEVMVDNCNVVLALWSGQPGGTANCIEYAESAGIPVLNVWAEWERWLEEVK